MTNRVGNPRYRILDHLSVSLGIAASSSSSPSPGKGEGGCIFDGVEGSFCTRVRLLKLPPTSGRLGRLAMEGGAPLPNSLTHCYPCNNRPDASLRMTTISPSRKLVTLINVFTV